MRSRSGSLVGKSEPLNSDLQSALVDVKSLLWQLCQTLLLYCMVWQCLAAALAAYEIACGTA